MSLNRNKNNFLKVIYKQEIPDIAVIPPNSIYGQYIAPSVLPKCCRGMGEILSFFLVNQLSSKPGPFSFFLWKDNIYFVNNLILNLSF